ncbi:MAG TPA: cytochrome c oxidase subunit 3 [Noviherbaspirillum sp.]|nr:cytochrome c oxidase subunit 3 [Noviherbaspirillum sp.]
MSASVTFKLNGAGRGDGGDAFPAADSHRRRPVADAAIGLWVFMGVAGALFSLFIAAYVMRMDGSDWSPIAPPQQLWLSTALLVAGSVLMQAAGVQARAMWLRRARLLLLLGGACALAFLAAQLWAWQALHAMQVSLAGNPAGSFFYLLTAMHGLHVLGGLAGWSVAAHRAWRAGPAQAALGITLCARYWHFLLAVWIVLFAAIGWLTPAVVRFICGTA